MSGKRRAYAVVYSGTNDCGEDTDVLCEAPEGGPAIFGQRKPADALAAELGSYFSSTKYSVLKVELK